MSADRQALFPHSNIPIFQLCLPAIALAQARRAGAKRTKFSLELEKMARFRNRLMHIYWDVDVAEIWRILQSRLGDFEKYISQIGDYLATKTNNDSPISL
ncbi:MAG: DUF86 domain-containing protein [Deltaproteobacteria bacterium]|nr:DUF86 domain-containing protein [Deltaproteobacteria bacterium]